MDQSHYCLNYNPSEATNGLLEFKNCSIVVIDVKITQTTQSISAASLRKRPSLQVSSSTQFTDFFQFFLELHWHARFYKRAREKLPQKLPQTPPKFNLIFPGYRWIIGGLLSHVTFDHWEYCFRRRTQRIRKLIKSYLEVEVRLEGSGEIVLHMRTSFSLQRSIACIYHIKIIRGGSLLGWAPDPSSLRWRRRISIKRRLPGKSCLIF